MNKCSTCIYRNKIESIKELDKNTIIFHEGDKVENIYFIKEGIIKLTKLYKNGEEKIMDILKEGDFIALLTILQNQENYLVTAETIKDTVVEVIDKFDALENYNNNSEFRETCIKCAAHRIGNFHNQLFSSSNIDPEEKILDALRHLYNKFGYMQNKKHYLKLPITKTEFANMVGLRRETLSRKLTKLKKDNIIDFEKNIYQFINM